MKEYTLPIILGTLIIALTCLTGYALEGEKVDLQDETGQEIINAYTNFVNEVLAEKTSVKEMFLSPFVLLDAEKKRSKDKAFDKLIKETFDKCDLTRLKFDDVINRETIRIFKAATVKDLISEENRKKHRISFGQDEYLIVAAVKIKEVDGIQILDDFLAVVFNKTGSNWKISGINYFLGDLSASDKRNRTYPAKKPGAFRLSMDLSAGKENYLLVVPASYKPAVSMPFLVLLHGAGDSPDNFYNSVWSLAQMKDTIVMVPQTIEQDNLRPIKMMDNLMEEYNIDEKRIYCLGFSLGASNAAAVGLPKKYQPYFAAVCLASWGSHLGEPKATKESPAVALVGGKNDSSYNSRSNNDVVPTRDRLKGLGYDLLFRDFDGGHQLPPASILQEIFNWMKSKVKP
ncbi:MAG: hypothetical protein HY762_00315 [Planctomycetes bacterium]|nr:hypothetical protein [Planctomycetota bacterium]